MIQQTLLAALTLGALLTYAPAPAANAGQIEAPDRSMSRVDVTYAEPVPTNRFPSRTYFETNDGAAYRYVTYGSCARSDTVPNRVCQTVFWYAR